MQLPGEIVIFGRTYDVRDLDQIHLSEGVLGLACFRDGTIYMDRSMDSHLSLTTLWHEAVHVAQQEILGETDELQARWMSLFVHNFLLQNPAILECYMDSPDRFAPDDGEGEDRPE